MNWNGRRVLVTGAGGFIGSHLTERLVTLGAETRALVRYNAAGSWGWLDDSPARGQIDVLAGDVCDQEVVRRAMRKIDVVFHLAALISIPYSYQAPASYIRTNTEGTLNVLLVAREAGVGLVVHTSTSEVYGSAQHIPIDESHPLQAQSPYAASKIGADKLVEAFHLSFDLPVVTLRPFNTFGPRQSARAVIPTIIAQCLVGDTIRLGNLQPTRDLNFVANTVDGFVLAAVRPEALGRTINLGSGREISVGELAILIGRLIGKQVMIETEVARERPDKSEVQRLLADNRLAGELLGWQPTIGLEAGLERTIDWIQQHLGRYRPGIYAV